ncbi:MAG: PAAR-like domain-containing protein [Polyangiaceae bacterium]
MSFHNVYANDRSISCKAGIGSSRAAFPDPCWTPPQTSPVVVPYPNTAHTKDLTEGSKTVFIQGTEVAKKDVSYFATSVGDAPATNSCGQGVATGVILGKAYFYSWSPDVKAEGLNVCRHLDMMGHNQASVPSNTPLFPFIERGFFSSNPCKDEEKAINRKCAEEEDKDDGPKLKKKKKWFNRKGKNRNQKSGPKDWHWSDDHCDGLEIAPLKGSVNEYLEEYKQAFKEITDYKNLFKAAQDELLSFVGNYALKAGGKIALKAGAKQLGGSALPVAGNIAMGLWTIYDIGDAVLSYGDYQTLLADVQDQVKAFTDVEGKLKGLLDKYKAEGGSSGLMADVMDLIASVNPCVRARKCNLVPYDKSGGASATRAAQKQKGCCPGQTGHHLILGVMAEGQCPGYRAKTPASAKHKNAPTVCVEGTNQHMGSHGRVHSAMDKQLGLLAKKGRIAPDGTISQADAVNAAVESHAAAFPLSGCSKACIKAQLEAFYNQECPGSRYFAKDKNGKLVTADTAGADDGAK